jgi:hypothetical protein
VNLDNPALRRVGLGHLAGGDSPRGSPWNGCQPDREVAVGTIIPRVLLVLTSFRALARAGVLLTTGLY